MICSALVVAESGAAAHALHDAVARVGHLNLPPGFDLIPAFELRDDGRAPRTDHFPELFAGEVVT